MKIKNQKNDTVIKDELEKDFNKSDYIIRQLSNINLQIIETRKDIESSIVPKFIDISPQLKDLIELSIEIWRLENRINKNLEIQESQKEMLINSIQKIKRYLEKNDIEILDYTNKKFNEGRNLEILAVEKDPSVKESIIKETKEPTIMCKGQIVRKGKVIVLNNEQNSVSEAQKNDE